MRYSSKQQEFFAERGRVKVYKDCYPSSVGGDYYEYRIVNPSGGYVIKTNKQEAISLAKNIAVKGRYAFNPLFDYEERICSDE